MMEKYDIRPIPANFEIWFEYATGRNPDLNRTLDILIGNGEEFTENRCREIYHQFFAATYDEQEIASTARSVQKQVKKILDFIEQVSAENSDYGEALKTFSTDLLGEMSLEEMRTLLDGVIERTEKMHDSNRKLQTELQRSSQEIDVLRENLTEAQRETLTDSLTGLANRRGFELQLRESAMTAMETGTNVALVMVDIDHFKAFNDAWGHLLGDQVLKLVGQRLRETIAPNNTVARFGGEEFVVLVPASNLGDAVALAETLRKEIASRAARKKDTGESIGHITCSFGVALFRKGEPLPEFIKRADTALYLAKERGRNAVVDEGELPELATPTSAA